MVRLGEPAGGKDGLAYAGEVSGSEGAIGIGATNAVGGKSVTTAKGAQITERRDAVGGTPGADDVAALFGRLTFGDGRGDVEGIDGLSLVALTTDAFTIAIDKGRAVDAITFEVGEGWFAANGFDTGADVGDGQSRFSAIDDATPTVVRTAGLLGDLVGGGSSGQADQEAILMAAIDAGDGRVTLLGLEGDTFAVRVNGDGRTDTLLIATSDTAAAIAALESGVVNAGNGADEFVIVEAGDTGGVAIGGEALNVTDPAPGSSAPDIGGGSTSEAFVLADTAPERPNATAIDQGGTVRVEFASSGGGRHILVVDDAPDAPSDLVDGGPSVPSEDFLF